MAKPATTKKQAPAPSTVTDKKKAGKTPIQTKLAVGAANDRYEAEADRVAAHVTGPQSLSAAPPMISRLTHGAAQTARAAPKPKDDKTTKAKQATKTAQKKATGGSPAKKPVDDKTTKTKPANKTAQKKAATGTPAKKPVDDKTKGKTTAQREGPDNGAAYQADAGTEARIDAARGGGSPLPATTRSDMGERMGHDLSGVRVHNDATSHQLARDLDAHAFTVGNDVFFGRGQYQPNTGSGKKLLAHELTHTVQQGGGSGKLATKRIQRAKPKTAPTPPTPSPPSGTAAPTPTTADPTTTTAPPTVFEGDKGAKIDLTPQSNGRHGLITLPVIGLPVFGRKSKGFKGGANAVDGLVSGPDPAYVGGTAISPLGMGPFNYRGGEESQGGSVKWDAGSAKAFGADVNNAFLKNIDTTGYPTFLADKKPFYYLRTKGTQSTTVGTTIRKGLFMGTQDVLSNAPEVLRPQWNAKGDTKALDVDHFHERSLGGADDFSNYNLLDYEANRSAGPTIVKAIDSNTMALVAKAAAAPDFWKVSAAPLHIDKPAKGRDIRDKWNIDFLAYEEIKISGNTDNYWSQSDIRAGLHLQGLRPASAKDLVDAHIATDRTIDPTFFSVFTSRGGGRNAYLFQKDDKKGWRVTNRPDNSVLAGRENPNVPKTTGSGFQYTGVDFKFDPDAAMDTKVGSISGFAFKALNSTKANAGKSGLILSKPELTLDLMKADPLGSVTYIDHDKIIQQIGGIDIKGASPITLDDAGFTGDGQLYAHGMIGVTKALFPGLQVPIHIVGEAIYISFPIPTDKLSFGPVAVTRAAIDIGYDNGLFLGGNADVTVDKLGSGHLEAKSGADGPEIAGDFNFDVSFLDPASASFTYAMASDSLTVSLNAGIKKGALPGIESGQVTATMSRDGVDFHGTLSPAGFLSGAQIALSYTDKNGITIELNDYHPPLDKFPAIKDATVSLGANKPPQSSDWTFYGKGSAQFAIPHVTGGIDIAMHDDAVLFRGTGAVEHGPAKGSLDLTVTNKAVDPKGNPIEGPTQANFTIFGHGSATMTFGLITATAGLTYTPDGEIIVDGELALPPTFELFPQKRYDKELLHVAPPEFPIWGVSLAGFGIGIFAFFDAYLKFDASIGPGTINHALLTATYNFEHPEDTVIDGSANFNVPAAAGFTVDVGGGLRARVAVAEVSGRVGLAARLGLEANAGADLNLHWTPQAGLSIGTELYANVSPKFTLSANASVTASVDLGLWEPSHTWGPWEKQLGEFGPNMACEVRMPVNWSEQNGLDFNVDNIQIKKPEVDYADLMKSAFLELV